MNTLKITLNSIVISIALATLSMPRMLLAEPTEAECQSPDNQADMNICAGRDAEAADRRLNQVYTQLKAEITNLQSVKELINAETAWIKFRDSNCEFVAGFYRGGSIVPTIHSGCFEALTKQRTKQLEDYLQDLLK